MLAYLAVIVIMILNYTSYKNGDWFYKLREKLDKKPKVFDLAYAYLPKLQADDKYINILNWFFGILPFMPFFFSKVESNFELFTEMIQYFIPVYLIRALTTNLTILPPDQKCTIKQFTFNELIQGHCYDKLFSGHLALAMIAMYIFWKHHVISSNYLAINVFLTVIYMLISRGHYSNDLIFSFFVVYFVINQNVKLSF
jgi:hypothetical protein